MTAFDRNLLAQHLKAIDEETPGYVVTLILRPDRPDDRDTIIMTDEPDVEVLRGLINRYLELMRQGVVQSSVVVGRERGQA